MKRQLEMSRIILLLGIALRANTQAPVLRRQHYLLEIDNGILNNVKPYPQALGKDVDLSDLGLRSVQKNAFDQLVNIKSLNLDNNSLQELPEFVFANLTTLQALSLAKNNFNTFQNNFVGLNNLKTLNISYNPLKHLRKSFFFGLTKSTEIITEGNEFWSISTELFENPFLREMEPNHQLEFDESPDKNPTLRNNDDNLILDDNLKVKICKTAQGVVNTVEELQTNETLSSECKQAGIIYERRTLVLKNLGLKAVQKGWYKLNKYPFNSIDLSMNNIEEITPELLNDLPENLAFVNLAGNKIKQLRRNIIENNYLKVLNLKDNLIMEIEGGALEKTQLSGFFIIGNCLKSLSFASTLPITLTEMIASQNDIEEIPENSMANLKNLVYLNLAHNNITELKSNTLRGLTSLQVLILTDNKLKTIEEGAFKDMINLRTLYLYRNAISDLKSGFVRGLENLKDLNLAWNNIKKITNDTFIELPDTLRDLHLDFNEIESLEVGSFVDVPKFTLSLDGNKISAIPRGAFNLPYLHELHLKNNSLQSIDGDAFEGLWRLRRLSLNANNITSIKKGAAKNMGRIHLLDLSKNPIEKLENGALFGLPKSRGCFVYLSDTFLKIIQGGIFDDV
ncbi:GSCOCG00009769001-RA-CDS [Cotesia congregata]|uniref:Similar to atk: Protein artichoke (Drosophila melanogaster) n=1 Tax=Cotesia congregata TaxID=51543 RepID=A0A8J2MF69_COTCN|nr:GSCOCG00009769001-RA-CDS [Cotesia congregata]CAG5088485.1 Similar to atk: Protein artichoke (Drosophila melanogaster) [Cotesia congregata]